MNLYAYISNNPLNLFDLLGLEETIRGPAGFSRGILDSVYTRAHKFAHPEQWGPGQGVDNFMLLADIASIGLGIGAERIGIACVSKVFNNRIKGRIIRTDLHSSTGGAAFDPLRESGKHLKDIFIDPNQLKGRKDLYEKIYHESAHRWIYNKTLGSKVKVPRAIDEAVSGMYGKIKANLRYFLGEK